MTWRPSKVTAPRQFQAHRLEFLGAPAGAEPGRHPLAADEDGELAELPEQ